MSKVKSVWKMVDGVTPNKSISGLFKDLIGHKEINCHIIFYVRMGLQLKARFVAIGHMT